jgi:protein-S-isoprenylcysteine O-methyltransferase Ste14
MMLFLRIFLVSGMIIHKLVWEVLKRRENLPVQAKEKPALFSLKSIVKMGKTLVLLFLVIQTLFLDIFPILEQANILRMIGVGIYVLGLCVAIFGRLQLGNNWANLEDYQVLPGQSLVKSGLYRFIRHPIYIGDVLLILGLELALNSWLVLGVSALFILVFRQAKSEEAVLSSSFPGYDEYREQTKMFIPYLV